MTLASESLGGTNQRDRMLLSATLLLLALLAWVYLVYLAAGMRSHEAMAMPAARSWSMGQVGGLVLMWIIMMIAMMLPAAVPAILAYDQMSRQGRSSPGSFTLTASFTLGYVLTWASFGAVAALAQSALSSADLLTPSMRSASPLLGGSLLLAAGIYQWLPLKAGCLQHCREPGMAIRCEVQEGVGGALLAGLRHGLFCVGCCGFLMLLLFVAGVMNLLWVVAIAAFVTVEKLVRHGPLIGMLTGAVLAAWGLWVVVSS